jgi:hypothetical protein
MVGVASAAATGGNSARRNSYEQRAPREYAAHGGNPVSDDSRTTDTGTHNAGTHSGNITSISSNWIIARGEQPG